MTREEATHKLDFMKKAYQKLIDEKVDNGKLVGKDITGVWKAETTLDEAYKSMIEALDMAIKALEQQPCEDCISRAEALKIFGDVHPMDYNTRAYITQIEDLPSVTPTSDAEGDYESGYNCGYTDAMNDIAESGGE